MVAFEFIDLEMVPEEFGAVPAVPDVVIFSNMFLKSANVVELVLEDVAKEGSSENPKGGKIPGVIIDGVSLTSTDIGPI